MPVNNDAVAPPLGTAREKERRRIPRNPGFAGDDETTCLAMVKSSTLAKEGEREREREREREKGKREM